MYDGDLISRSDLFVNLQFDPRGMSSEGIRQKVLREVNNAVSHRNYQKVICCADCKHLRYDDIVNESTTPLGSMVCGITGMPTKKYEYCSKAVLVQRHICSECKYFSKVGNDIRACLYPLVSASSATVQRAKADRPACIRFKEKTDEE